MLKRIGSALVLVAGLGQGTAQAEVPRVVADIAPVQSLVAQVMDGLGTPALILGPGASPHDYALRPSEASALQRADLVFWTGAALTPWLDGPLAALAGDAQTLDLMALPGTHLLPRRDLLQDMGGDDDDHAHHDDHADHHHGDVDPHAWLDPDNARLWLAAIARALSAADPENAARYQANAAEGQAAIDAAETWVDEALAPFRPVRYMVFHDAYQYFETAFGLRPAGAIALSEAAAPGPARVAALRDLVADRNVACVFSEPQFSDAMIRTVFEGSEVRHAVLDPMGSDIASGPAFYPALLRGIAQDMLTCVD